MSEAKVPINLSPAKKALLELKLKQTRAASSAHRIPTQRGAGRLPLSFAQQRLWVLEQIYPGTCSYNVPRGFRVKGVLDAEALQEALNAIVKRHESLRTTFESVDGSPIQIVNDSNTVPLQMIDVSGEPDAEASALRYAELEVRKTFNLSSDRMLRATLIRIAPRHHVVVLVTHHIASDGWSRNVLVRELAEFYNAAIQQRASALPPLPIQYADFAVWQRQQMSEASLGQQLNYWRRQLSGAPALELPADFLRPARQSFAGAKLFPELPKQFLEATQLLSQRQGTTLFMTLLAAFSVLMRRYSGQDDVVLGTPVSGRNLAETEPLIGDFINMLVLRTDVSGNPTFEELLGRVRQVVLEAFDNQDVPFERLVEELDGRDLSRTPLFQVMFILENAPPPPPRFQGVEVEILDLDTGVAKSDLIFSVRERDHALAGKLEFSTELFRNETITRMWQHYGRLLTSIVEAPQAPILSLGMLTTQERRQVVFGWNATDTEAADSCIHQLFEEQAEQRPQAIAVASRNEKLTYAELNARSNQLAHQLASRGVRPGSLVGLCVERSARMMVGLLGIMKSGAAYVPLDPAYPKDRLGFMAEYSELKVIVTEANLADALPPHTAELVCMDRDAKTIAAQPASNPEVRVAATDRSYVIFTSGSTGRPKGVELEHRNVVNFLRSTCIRPGLSAQDVYLGVASMSFDASVMDFYLPLSVGATLVVVDSATVMDPRSLAKAISDFDVTAMHATPSTWRMLVEGGWTGSPGFRVFAGGEALPWDLAKELLARTSAVWNLYGPTETAVYSAVHQVRPDDGTVFVGRPIANTQIYVLDSELQPTPIGVPGELCISGTGVSRGYLKRPDLTAERFLADPFLAGNRMYRTGDLGRFRPDGTLECLGRTDHQVKIRGFRIELAEIESVLQQHPAVRQAVVIVREDTPGDKRLVAYTVAAAAAAAAIELRNWVASKLPPYMVPSAFVTLASVPLSPNGKIDRRALPVPEKSTGSAERVAPSTPFQVQLAAIWESVLRTTDVGIHDNFFELGGHSLLATQLISRLRDNFQVELPTRSVFEAPTIAEFEGVLSDALSMALKGSELSDLLAEVEEHSGS